MIITDSTEVLEKIINYAKNAGILDENEEAAIDSLYESLVVQKKQSLDIEHSCDDCFLVAGCSMIGKFGLSCPGWIPKQPDDF